MGVFLRQRKCRDGKISLWLDIYDNGKRRNEYLQMYLTDDKVHDRQVLRVAEQLRNKRELELLNSIYDFNSKIKSGTLFFQYAENYIRNTRIITTANYENMLSHLERYRGRNIRLTDINASFCEGFKDYLLQSCKPGTVFTYLAKFKRILNLAVDDGLIVKNPCKRVRIKGEEQGLKYLTQQELESLSGAYCPNEHLKLAFLFSCFTGLRWSDIVNLKWEDVEDNKLELMQQKTSKRVVIPLSQMAQLILKKVKVIPISNMIPIQLKGVIFTLPTLSKCNKQLKLWCANAEIKKRISYHWSRHTFGTIAAANGIDILTISKLMGHRKIGTTLIYAQVLESEKRNAVERLPVLGFQSNN